MQLPIKHTNPKPHDHFYDRPVVNQTCDPTCKLCKELQKIIQSEVLYKGLIHFKQIIPTLALIHKKIQNDKLLKERTKW